MLTIWRNFRIEVPDEWEMLQFSREVDAGRCAFADRYQFRAEVSWRKVDGKPDMERMMSDYRARILSQGGSPAVKSGALSAKAGSVAGKILRSGPASEAGATARSDSSDGERPDVTVIEAASWKGLRVLAGGRLATRFGRFFPGESCVVEMVFLYQTAGLRRAGTESARLERAILKSVRVEPEHAGAFRRWRAFGLDVLASKGLLLSKVTAEPARARMTFGPLGLRPGPKRNGSVVRPVVQPGRGRVERFERLGMTSHWLRRSVGEWLKARVEGTARGGGGGPSGFVPDEGPSASGQRIVSGHEIHALRGSRPAPGLSRLWGGRVRCEAAAWVCPGDGRLYYAEISGLATEVTEDTENGAGEKGVRNLLCEAPVGPSRQKVPDTFFPFGTVPLAGGRLSCCPLLSCHRGHGVHGGAAKKLSSVSSVTSVARSASPGVLTEGSWREMLLAVPVRNAAAEARSEGVSGLRLSVKKRRLRFLVPPLSWIIKPRETRELVLDGLGAAVWDICGGAENGLATEDTEDTEEFKPLPFPSVPPPRRASSVIYPPGRASVADASPKSGGERTVEEVVDEFARRHSLTFHEARVAVTGYMKVLVERGALVMLADCHRDHRETGRMKQEG